MTIILSSPGSALRPEMPARPARQMSWTGIDGSVWSLSDVNANPGMRPGVRGLHMPRIEVHETSTPLVPGTEVTGYSIAKRSVYWPLMFLAQSVTEWEETHAAFMDSFDPVQMGIWTVGEGEKARTLPLRGDFRGDYDFDRDPFVTGYAIIGVELEAPRPLWRGKKIERTFSNGAGDPFIPPGGGTPLYISPAATFSTANISNPGDEWAYLLWTLVGPLTGISVGVGGAVIDVPFDLAPGEVLVIDTDPSNQYATLNGADSARELGFQQFGPVPARGTTQLLISAAGAGVATASLVPLYRRAY